MTYFPGEDYLTYVSYALTYPRRARPSRAIVGGIRKFIDVKDFTPDYLDRRIKGWEEYVYVDEKNQTVKITYADPLSTEQAGYWNIRAGTLDELVDLSYKYSKIFVHIDEQSRTFINMWKPKYSKKVRWLYEIQERMRDTLSIIVYGTFDYEVYYCMGLAGGGRSAGIFYEREIIFPDGRSHPNNNNGQSWGPWTHYRNKYPNVSNLALSFRMLKITPILNKEFYEEKVPFNPYENAKRYDAADISSFFFCRNFRNKGKTDFIKRKAVYSKGGNATRPDQHRFLYGDGALCDKCTLNYCCKLYRKGGVCIVAGTEGSDLVKKFMSDKATDIVSGMQYLLAEEVVILENELERRKKEISEGMDPSVPMREITRQINSVMAHGEKVAKLKDPSLTKPKVNITMPAVPGKTHQGEIIEGEIDNTPRLETMSDREKQDLIRRMERVGYNRKSITVTAMREFLEAESKNVHQLSSGATGLAEAGDF